MRETPSRGGRRASRKLSSTQPRSRPSSRQGHRLDESSNKNFKVVVRVRPPLPRELHGVRAFQNVIGVDKKGKQITISENLNAQNQSGEGSDGSVSSYAGPYSTHRFTFDQVYHRDSSQLMVYETTAKAVVDSSLEGYNATIFAYGQTGTGKTFTMEGFNNAEERGIIPRAIEQIFNHIQTTVSPRMRFLVRASYLQIYNEVISDLLKPERTNLIIREDKRKGVFVEGLSEWVVRTPQEIYGLMERGGTRRATGSTKMNEMSSRSHAVFIIICEQSETVYMDNEGRELSPEALHNLLNGRKTEDATRSANMKQSFKVGKLNLVDLAGSERVRLTGATGQRLEESKKINQSLAALGNVISALTDVRGRQHIPYRDSKLTRILEDSLGGNCKTTMMAMISPALEAYRESLSTLKFANRAKNIKNEATINEDLDQKSLLRKYEMEVKKLRNQLATRNRNIIDQRRFLELDEQRRRAEEDKMAAIRALEERSLEFMREKQKKKELEERLAQLQGQMIMGGTKDNLQQTTAFRAALKEQRDRIRKEYESKLKAIEREREGIEEERAQVDRYKQLLLKQRDIMIALTQRLNERDEQIMALQDELDAYDRHQKELEEKLDEKTAALIHLQRVTIEHNAKSPEKSNELSKALGDWGDKEGAMFVARHAMHLKQQQQEAQKQVQAQMQQQVEQQVQQAQAVAIAKQQAQMEKQQQQRREKQQQSVHTTPKHQSQDGMMSATAQQQVKGSRSVAPQRMIDYKQYAPFDKSGSNGSSIIFSSSTPTTDDKRKAKLLSAEEKIKELASVVDAMQGDCNKLRRELEEVRAEKVSMEYLLREKLERLVQNEIEVRLKADRTKVLGRRAGGSESALASASATASNSLKVATESPESKSTIARLRAEIDAARADRANANDEIQALRRKLSHLEDGTLSRKYAAMGDRIKALTEQHGTFRTEASARLEEKDRLIASLQKEVETLKRKGGAVGIENGGPGTSNRAGTSGDVQKALVDLRNKCTIHERERQAIETIMEHKVKRLTDNIARLVSAASADAGHGASAARMKKEVVALQRLVNAAVTALHNSEVKVGKKV